MQLEQQRQTWSGTVPIAADGRVLTIVVVASAFAASLNVPYGGLPVAVGAFFVLATTGTVAHFIGERRLRRITDGLVDRWLDSGGQITNVTRSKRGMRTEWTVHTPDGEVTVGGIALAPISRLGIEWQGVGDTMDAHEAEADLDNLATGLFEEIFAIGDAPRRS